MVYVVSTRKYLDCGWNFYILSNTFQSPIDIHVIKYSKAANLFEILTWYC
jgi:hypothetical protein